MTQQAYPEPALQESPNKSGENALQRFTRDTRELFGRVEDIEQRWSELTAILARLLADPDVQQASVAWPVCVPANGRAENLLFYEDPGFGFTVNGLTKSGEHRGRGRIHDHAHIYTLYGVLAGHERIEGYERLDDRSVPDYAEIEKIYDLEVGPGEIGLVKPYEIHTEISLGERTAAVIIRSEKQGSFNQGRYELETHRYYESLGPRLTPCDMLPGS
jgi:predicted metal-dependent enzyme (double-stranded beta helix superfamily)